MLNEESMRLKEELDGLRMKCDEINKELCRQLDENKKLSQSLEKAKVELATVQEDNAFLRGKVEAYEFVFDGGGMSRG